MRQSRVTSLAKSCISTGVGFGISLGAQIVFLPLLGVEIGLTQNTAFALIMTAISIARGYLLERLFEFFRMSTRLSAGASAILAERQRQVDAEGHKLSDDDQYAPGILAAAGASYAECAFEKRDYGAPRIWPWDHAWWNLKDARRNLIRAGALILAELERHDRTRGRAP